MTGGSEPLRRRVARALRRPPATAASPGRIHPPRGMVEHFSRRLVVGWLSVPADVDPIRVTLHVGKVAVSSTFATPGAAMSAPAGHRDAASSGDVEEAASSPAGTLHPWQLPNLPGPAGDRRNSGRQIRTFSFAVRGIWPYVKRSTRITVKVDGVPLPIAGHGMFLLPPRNGKQSPARLRELLDAGHVLTQFGTVELAKSRDHAWQASVLGLYHEVREVLADTFGHELFLVGGTLLGAVREGGYIGHDVDFDAAYLSRHTRGPDAADELVQVAVALIRAGYVVDARQTCLHVQRVGEPDIRIDVFHVYFDEDGLFAFPWGVAGTSTVRREDWRGTRRTPFPGGWGLIPDNAEQMVEHLYGADWRLPKPGFNWNLERTAYAAEGRLTDDQRGIVHWESRYAYHDVDDPSSFCRLVDQRPDTPAAVLDLGCGDGRDAIAFAAAGRSVSALDRSELGVQRARLTADQLGVSDRVSVQVCDFHDPAGLHRLLDGELRDGEPVLFYLRFLLHSLDEKAQAVLLEVIAERARPGDVLAAEFRTTGDAQRPKHQRLLRPRFVDGDAVVAELVGAGFEPLLDEEGVGLSPYHDEDPLLRRVIMRRR